MEHQVLLKGSRIFRVESSGWTPGPLPSVGRPDDRVRIEPVMPHTRALAGGLFELRLKSKEGIGRVFFCTLAGGRVIMLHGFVKKSQKTPTKDLRIARQRLAEVKANEPR